MLRRIYPLAVMAIAACSKNDGAKSGDSHSGAPTDTAAAPTTTASAAPKDSAAATPQKGQVGMRYDSLPPGFTYRDGSIIPPSAATHNGEYDLSRVTTPAGDVVWLDTLGAPLGKGQRAKTVRAELPIPALAKDERLFMASCDVKGKLDPQVVAIVVNEAGATKFTKIRQAWRVNIPAARFDVLPVTGITCEDPGS